MVKIKTMISLSLLFQLALCILQVENKNSKLDGKCNSDLPNLSIGDFNITNANYV